MLKKIKALLLHLAYICAGIAMISSIFGIIYTTLQSSFPFLMKIAICFLTVGIGAFWMEKSLDNTKEG